MARATTSLPVPVSPVISTVTSTPAASPRMSRTSRMLGLCQSSISLLIAAGGPPGTCPAARSGVTRMSAIARSRSPYASGVSRTASTASSDDWARIAALELQALDHLRGIVAIQIEVEEREAEAAVGERFEGFTDGGCQDGGVPSHAEKGEQMTLHPCAAFDNQNTLIFHAVGPPPGYEQRALAQTACHS